eukprot:6182993-Pleurochrysis_carterae.AAC.2
MMHRSRTRRPPPASAPTAPTLQGAPLRSGDGTDGANQSAPTATASLHTHVQTSVALDAAAIAARSAASAMDRWPVKQTWCLNGFEYPIAAVAPCPDNLLRRTVDAPLRADQSFTPTVTAHRVLSQNFLLDDCNSAALYPCAQYLEAVGGPIGLILYTLFCAARLFTESLSSQTKRYV